MTIVPKNSFNKFLILSASLLSVSCVSNEAKMEQGMTLCPEVRPQVCTQDYKPVCARFRDGSRRTYANACSACADVGVVGYSPGECKVEKRSSG